MTKPRFNAPDLDALLDEDGNEVLKGQDVQ
jgi:hypothetical protein